MVNLLDAPFLTCLLYGISENVDCLSISAVANREKLAVELIKNVTLFFFCFIVLVILI